MRPKHTQDRIGATLSATTTLSNFRFPKRMGAKIALIRLTLFLFFNLNPNLQRGLPDGFGPLGFEEIKKKIMKKGMDRERAM